VAALRDPGQITAMAGLPDIRAIYLNRRFSTTAAFTGLLLHESVPSIRADAVQTSGITGKGVGSRSSIRGSMACITPISPTLPTVQNVKVVANLADVFTDSTGQAIPSADSG